MLLQGVSYRGVLREDIVTGKCPTLSYWSILRKRVGVLQGVFQREIEWFIYQSSTRAEQSR
jgi:hypothetical protein